ncbi:MULTISPECIES: fimbrillin family protein [Bacteroidaceae]|uniref:fimbrillin family protein n=1 Tax=Bacteroidaceae TaxID=815 RepID=UPI001362F6B9|nr:MULTISPECIES: fimbrillin family protein [Bacteroidaceae]NBH64751.1 fimbrillin family protein [Phocaeicola sartorii]
MKAKLFMTMAAATMILAGCSNDENEVADNWNGEIRLTSGVTVQTRSNTQATQIQEGETVYVWADKASSTADYIKAWKLTAGSSNDFTGTSQYYPTDGSNLDFYALHGNFASNAFTENTTEFPATAIVHSVEADQSGTEAYTKSDLLYAVQKNVPRSSNAVELSFYHMLSKVEVALKSGNGKPNLTGAAVTIVGTKLKADFTPDKSATMTDQSARAGMITIPGDNNDAAPIKIRTVTTDNLDTNSEYGEAVVLPKQTISQNTPFIQVTLANKAVFSYKIPDAGGLTLESGKKYTYKITVNQTGLTVTSKIENWTSEEKTGDAEMD